MDILVSITNIYNECDLDYFMQSIGTAFGTVSGFLNFLTNFFLFRFLFDTDAALYTSLSTAVVNENKESVGLYFGQWFRRLLMVEIPPVTKLDPWPYSPIEQIHTD